MYCVKGSRFNQGPESFAKPAQRRDWAYQKTAWKAFQSDTWFFTSSRVIALPERITSLSTIFLSSRILPVQL